MSANKQFVRREIIARERDFVALVISQPRLIDFDQTVDGAPIWSCDLDIGGNRVVKNVPIKPNGAGSRFYAQLNQTVLVRRTALGRLFVISPGDRVLGPRNTTSYSLETGDQVTAGTESFTREFFPFEFYMGPTAMKGNPVVTFAQTGGNDTITRATGDWAADGFVVTNTVRIGGTTINDGVITIAALPSATVLETADTLFNEGPKDNVSVGVTSGGLGSSLWNDGVTGFPLSRLVDSDGNPV